MSKVKDTKADIIKHLGFFPSFYKPALGLPDILENLWSQTLNFFIKNPLPLLFKEKLAALLSRYCSVPYCLVVHSSNLMPLGMTASDVLDLLEMPALSYQEIIEKTQCDEGLTSKSWPLPDSSLEECILYCCVAIFLNQEKERFYEKLRKLLSSENFNHLVKLLSYNKTCLDWAEAHPEISYEQDQRYQEHFQDLIEKEPKLITYFQSYRQRFSRYFESRFFWLTQENKRLQDKEDKSRREAERNRQNLNNLIMQMPIPMCAMEGPKHVFTLMNPPYLKTFGLDESALGKTFNSVFTSAEAENVFFQIDKVYKTGTDFSEKSVPVHVQDTKGLQKTVLIDVDHRAVRTSDGQINGIFCFIQDVTEQVRTQRLIEESERHFRSLANLIPQIVFVLNEFGEITYINQKSIEFTGLEGSEFSVKDWLDKIHPEDREQVKQEYQRGIQNKTEFQVEFRLLRKDGTYRWHLTRALPIKESGFDLEFFGTTTDVQVYKSLTEELEEAREIAENANRTKSAFLANMSHEIRTPLGAILGFSELLKDPQVNSSERFNYLNIISRNGKALTHIIDDILDLSKVESGKFKLEELVFKPRSLIEEVVDLFSETVKSKGIYLKTFFETEIPDYVVSDPTRIRQILNNIIGNAVKFTDQGGIEIHVTAQKIQDQFEFKILVSDTGPGFPQEQLKNLFQPFVQVDSSTTRKFGGTGLGLVLSRKMALALEGDVEVISCEQNLGCHFMVRFKTHVASTEMIEALKVEVPQKYVDRASLDGIRVLVVEDSKDNQNLIHKVLTKCGADVDFASDGEQGVEKALSHYYDIVFMDIQMPKLDGYGATKKLREQGYVQPIIALTAHAMEEERQKTKEAGCDGHITKPLDIALLISTVSHFTPVPRAEKLH